MKFSFRPYLFILLILFLAACGSLPKSEQFLLKKNKIAFHGNRIGIDKSELENLFAQEPNKKSLGLFQFKRWSYQLPERGKDRKIKDWMRKKFGDSPVYFDDYSTQKSVNQMRLYLKKLGYFNSVISTETITKRNKIQLTYHIEPGRPYLINTYDQRISDSSLVNIFESIKSESLIKSGNIYNEYALDDERERITNYLKNNGFYRFYKEYIYFEIDSTLNYHMMNVHMIIKNPQTKSNLYQDSLITDSHKPYTLGNIYVDPDYNLQNITKVRTDTMSIKIGQSKDSNISNQYYFLHNGQMRIKPNTVTQSILLKNGDLFSIEKVKNTYKRLSGISVFKYSDIQFIENGISNEKILDAYINLARSKVQSYTIEAEGTNSAGKPGIGANLVYTNKNIFRGAEVLQIRLKGAFEASQFNNTLENNSDGIFLNTIETGGELSLSIPKFLLPFRKENFNKSYQPKTSITTGLNYMKRSNYRRYISHASFGYHWSPVNTTQHVLFPFELSSIRIFPTEEFQVRIDSSTNNRLKNQYTNHLISALKYSFIYNNQNLRRLRNFIYFRGNIESSGGLLKLYNNIAGSTLSEEGYHRVFGIRYAQYLRTDIDLRFYNVISKEQRFVVRTVFGIGLPYGNSEELPFEKGFFAGGANGMRGWELRRLGPGAYSVSDSTSFERIGDMQIEANLEYRFPIYSFLKGALFMDIGNIWLLNESDAFPNGKFKFDTFVSELALDAGLGFRFDFSFFIFRVDVAMRLRDPSRPKNQRWVIGDNEYRKLGWNFGIGYPF